ncbi:MAG: outer membrane beta-barrel protein [Vicinamibacterales bacterium]
MMNRTLVFTAVLGLIAAPHALAQTRESAPGPGRVEVTIVPGGGMFFTESEDGKAPAFGNYDLGGGLALNVNRFVGVEAEVTGALGISQSLDVNGVGTGDARTPHLLNYSGNLLLHAPGRSVVPYVTGGIGGQSLFERASLGVHDTETFLTGNVGGGLKWYAGRWGLRADYRFIAVRGKDDATDFWGQDTRYGHRVYAGVILNVAR